MAARPKLPVDVMVWGERHHVVMIKPTFWLCIHDGHLVSHSGRLLLDGQPEQRWLTEPKPCSRCKQPCWTATPRGRAIHMSCGPQSDVMPDHLHWQVVAGIAADLGATIHTED